LKRRFQVHILGQDLWVLADGGDEHVSKVVDFVEGKVEEVKKNTNTFNTLTIAILTALNIADEYLRSRTSHEETFEDLERRAERLINLIDETTTSPAMRVLSRESF